MEKVTYIKLFVDYLDAIEPLGDAERGRLFTSLLLYAKTGAVPQLGGNERFLFPMMKAQIDRDITIFEDVSKARSEAGKLGGRPKNQTKAKKAIAFSESKKSKDKDKDKDKDKEKDNTKEKIPTESKRKRFENPLLQEAFDGFAEMRMAIKKPLTERAADMIISKLDKLSDSVNAKDRYKIECLNQSVLHNWQGVFEVNGFIDDNPKHDTSELDKIDSAYQKYLTEHRDEPFSQRMTMNEFYEKWVNGHA